MKSGGRVSGFGSRLASFFGAAVGAGRRAERMPGARRMKVGSRRVALVPTSLPGGGTVWAMYDAGRRLRRDWDYMPRGLGVNAVAELGEGGLEMAVRRSRQLRDNNPLIDGAVRTSTDRIIGTGFTLEPNTPWPALNTLIAELVEFASEAIDPERCMSRTESERLFWEQVYTSGECGVHHVYARAFNGFPAMPAIELITRERVPLDVHGKLSDVNGGGNEVRQGVEVDADGRTVAYHVLDVHPRDGGMFGMMGGGTTLGAPGLRRIPVESMELAFISREPGQLRGIPRTITTVTTIRQEDSFAEACIDQAKLAACLGVFFESSDDELFRQEDGSDAAMVDSSGNALTGVDGFSVGFVRPGGAPKVLAANLPGPTFESTEKVLQRRIACGLSMSYSALSRDASDTSFSSMRGERLHERDTDQPDQRWCWRHHTLRWFRELIDWGVLTGALALTSEQAKVYADPVARRALYKVNVGYKGSGYVNPKDESAANATDIATGILSPVEAMQEQGRNWRDSVDKSVEFAKYRKDRMAALGVTEVDMAGAGKTAKAAIGKDEGSGGDGGSIAEDAEGDEAEGDGGGGDGAGARGGARARVHLNGARK